MLPVLDLCKYSPMKITLMFPKCLIIPKCWPPSKAIRINDAVVFTQLRTDVVTELIYIGLDSFIFFSPKFMNNPINLMSSKDWKDQNLERTWKGLSLNSNSESCSQHVYPDVTLIVLPPGKSGLTPQVSMDLFLCKCVEWCCVVGVLIPLWQRWWL